MNCIKLNPSQEYLYHEKNESLKLKAHSHGKAVQAWGRLQMDNFRALLAAQKTHMGPLCRSVCKYQPRTLWIPEETTYMRPPEPLRSTCLSARL